MKIVTFLKDIIILLLMSLGRLVFHKTPFYVINTIESKELAYKEHHLYNKVKIFYIPILHRLDWTTNLGSGTAKYINWYKLYYDVLNNKPTIKEITYYK